MVIRLGHTIQTHTYMMILRATHTQCYSGKRATTQTRTQGYCELGHTDTHTWGCSGPHIHGVLWVTIHTHTVLQWATQIYHMVILWVTHIHGDTVGHTEKMKLKAVLMWVMISDWMRI